MLDAWSSRPGSRHFTQRKIMKKALVRVAAGASALVAMMLAGGRVKWK